jgi:hypothetical protein
MINVHEIDFIPGKCKKYSMNFIYELAPHLSKYQWHDISISQDLSEDFMIKYSDKLSWHIISKYQKLSENFILNNLELINIDWLEENKRIPNELKEKVKFMKELAG